MRHALLSKAAPVGCLAIALVTPQSSCESVSSPPGKGAVLKQVQVVFRYRQALLSVRAHTCTAVSICPHRPVGCRHGARTPLSELYWDGAKFETGRDCGQLPQQARIALHDAKGGLAAPSKHNQQQVVPCFFESLGG